LTVESIYSANTDAIKRIKACQRQPLNHH
jgi:hypothetical protein